MRVGPVLNYSLLRLIAQNEGISYHELLKLNEGMLTVLFNNDLKELIKVGEVVEEDKHYWTREEYFKMKH